MGWYSMEVLAEARRADLLEEAADRALLRQRGTESSSPATKSIRDRLRMAIARRLTRRAAAS